MEHTTDTPNHSDPRRQREYEDPGYHDDIDVVPADDVERHDGRPPVRRKPTRRPPPRRWYED